MCIRDSYNWANHSWKYVNKKNLWNYYSLFINIRTDKIKKKISVQTQRVEDHKLQTLSYADVMVLSDDYKEPKILNEDSWEKVFICIIRNNSLLKNSHLTGEKVIKI